METTETFMTAPVMTAPSPNINTVPPVSYAGFWKRVAAYLIDGALVGAVTWILALVLGAGTVFSGMFSHINKDSLQDPEANAALAASIISLYFIIFGVAALSGWLYFALMESSAKQGTIGKMALGIKVTDLNGNRISFGRATGRFFGKIISGMILYIGFIMAGFTDKKQAMHDMIAGTLVVNK
jgi:uncharacterized RDD family membrane protein YckC